MDQKIPTASIVIKVQYQTTKLKFNVPDTSVTIQQLKEQLVTKLGEMGKVIDQEYIDCSDVDDFIITNSELVSAVLKDNDLVKIIDKPKPQPDHMQQLANDTQVQVPQKEDPTEAIVVLYDVSGSMKSSFFSDKDLSRIGAVNAFFSAFADKTMAFELNHVLKLVTFQSHFEDKCEFTSELDVFIHLVDSVVAGGGTALFDAMQYAIEALLKIKAKYPNIILRMIALTDGADNGSKCKPEDLVKRIIENQIVIDSFVVDKSCVQLKTLTHASGGRCYCPLDVNQGLQLFEIETILSVALRQKGQETIVQVDLNSLKDKPFDTDGIQVAQDVAVGKSVMNREQIIAKAMEAQKMPETVANTTGKAGASRRIYKELQDCLQTGNQMPFKVFPVADDIFTWKILLLGPQGSLYQGGKFKLLVKFPQDYPFKPPKVNFENRVYHCNVSRQGSLCLDVLKDQWSPALTVVKVMLSIHSLLSSPNPDDALDSTIASEMKHDPVLYQQKAISETKTHCDMSVDDMALYINGKAIDNQSNEYVTLVDDIKQWLAVVS